MGLRTPTVILIQHGDVDLNGLPIWVLHIWHQRLRARYNYTTTVIYNKNSFITRVLEQSLIKQGAQQAKYDVWVKELIIRKCKKWGDSEEMRLP